LRRAIGSERITALTDGVVAVIITIMVLELKPPRGADVASLVSLGPTFLSFVLSFVYVAIYWNNHHHFFKLVPHVTGSIMWSSLNLLFWLSLIPFATAWMDEHGSAPIPVAVYGLVLLLCALSWHVMQATIIRAQGPGSPVRQAVGGDLKGKLTPIVYLFAIPAAFAAPALSLALYAGLAAWWMVPDRRVEAILPEHR
jgi:uncharacterized membrane protein